jgi:hypothetical protein
MKIGGGHPMTTREEHIARAMLLEMEYKEWIACYIKSHEYGVSLREEWYDAETLELLSHDEKSQRLLASIREK